MHPHRRLLILGWLLLVAASATAARAEQGAIRVGTYNASLYRDQAGQLVRDLAAGDNEQARQVAEVIQRVRPDILLVNEFDYPSAVSSGPNGDPAGRAAELFRTRYLAVGQNGCEAIGYPYVFTAPVNTGRPSGRDLDKDGRPGSPADAIGYGRHEGQYGMLVLSRFPIDRERIRTFQNFLWRDMPGALLPVEPKTGEPFYTDEDLAVLRLSSKSFWDVPIKLGHSLRERNSVSRSEMTTLHLLCSHPTPPVFDGPEDRNGRRNHDEIRLIADYMGADANDYLVDDAGRRGGLPAEAPFVILGDLNCDPINGQRVEGAIGQLLDHPRVDASFTPTSRGGRLTVEQFPEQHRAHRGDPAHVTSNFTGEGHGCLRVDYALPSRGLTVVDGGVFWPAPGEPGSEAVSASDHRLVWIDVRPASH